MVEQNTTISSYAPRVDVLLVCTTVLLWPVATAGLTNLNTTCLKQGAVDHRYEVGRIEKIHIGAMNVIDREIAF